jgi:hypothetical protein
MFIAKSHAKIVKPKIKGSTRNIDITKNFRFKEKKDN